MEEMTPIEAFDGVGEEKAVALRNMGVRTARDVAETHGSKLLVGGLIGDTQVARMKKQAREEL
jgi:predicted RecB family nuclease